MFRRALKESRYGDRAYRSAIGYFLEPSTIWEALTARLYEFDDSDDEDRYFVVRSFAGYVWKVQNLKGK